MTGPGPPQLALKLSQEQKGIRALQLSYSDPPPVEFPQAFY